MRLNPLTDALLIIDMQLDFMPGGPLGVPGADSLIPALNVLAARFPHTILTQDWHPAGHISFANTHGRNVYEQVQVSYGAQALWPDHCLQATPGADLHPGLKVPHAEMILRKGFRADLDSYSAFLENDRRTPTGLAGYLRERGLTRLFFAGVAYDFCVGYSAVHARELGFESYVIEDLTRPVDLPGTPGTPGTVAATHERFAAAGVTRLRLAELQ